MPMQASKNISVATFDHIATDGLEGTVDSLSYRIAEADRHFHNYERWYGASAGPAAPGLETSNTGWRVTSSATANAFGTAVAIFDGTETYPSGAVKYDFHRVHILNVQTSALYRLRFAIARSGETSYADCVTNGDYTDTMLKVDQTNSDFVPLTILMRRVNVGTKLWAAVAKATDTAAWVDFVVGLHCYEG